MIYINAEEDRAKCIELGVASPPALVFYFDGKPITIRRPEWDDDIKCKSSF